MNVDTTTFRGHKLFILANQELEKRRTAKHTAYLAMKERQTLETAQAFLKANKAVEEAESYLQQVQMMQKHNRRVQ